VVRAPKWITVGGRPAPRSTSGCYPNELFPTRIRAAAVGMAIALTRFGAAVGTFLVPVSLSALGSSATMYIGAGITFVGLLACVAWAEETRHRSLEDIGADPARGTALPVTPLRTTVRE
jgi:putative MFS transporter